MLKQRPCPGASGLGSAADADGPCGPRHARQMPRSWAAQNHCVAAGENTSATSGELRNGNKATGSHRNNKWKTAEEYFPTWFIPTLVTDDSVIKRCSDWVFKKTEYTLCCLYKTQLDEMKQENKVMGKDTTDKCV